MEKALWKRCSMNAAGCDTYHELRRNSDTARVSWNRRKGKSIVGTAAWTKRLGQGRTGKSCIGAGGGHIRTTRNPANRFAFGGTRVGNLWHSTPRTRQLVGARCRARYDDCTIERLLLPVPLSAALVALARHWRYAGSRIGRPTFAFFKDVCCNLRIERYPATALDPEPYGPS